MSRAIESPCSTVTRPSRSRSSLDKQLVEPLLPEPRETAGRRSSRAIARTSGRVGPRNMRSWTSGAAPTGRRTVGRARRASSARPASNRAEQQAARAASAGFIPRSPRWAWRPDRRGGSAGRRWTCSASWGRCPAPCRRWPAGRARVTGRSSTVMPSALVRPTTWPPWMPPPASTVDPGVGIVVAARVAVDLRRAAELAHPDDQRRVEQAARLQVGHQRGPGRVERAAERL